MEKMAKPKIVSAEERQVNAYCAGPQICSRQRRRSPGLLLKSW
jgi:hypothetical protein